MRLAARIGAHPGVLPAMGEKEGARAVPLQADEQRGSVEVLRQDLVVLAARLDAGQTCVEHVDQVLLVGVEDREAVVGAPSFSEPSTICIGTPFSLIVAAMIGVSSKQAAHWPPMTA